MLLGREPERLRLDSLLDEARAGRSAALVLSGEAGIGKSALLAEAGARAEGFPILRARGFESESELAFSGLADLLQPVLGLLGSIPQPQAAALAGALSLGPPGQGDRYAVCAATLSLLAAAADASPVLVLLDDAQWLDASSTQAVLFATRRLDAEGVAVMIAVRTGAQSAWLDLPTVGLGALEPAAATALIRARAGEQPIAEKVAARLVADAAGNPLALIEIPGLLTPAQLAGVDPLPDALPAAPSVESAFRRQLAALSDEARAALVVAAASESGDLGEIAHALSGSGSGLAALGEAEKAEIVRVDASRVEFRHPLLRAAAYRTAPASTRRAAHEALARAEVGPRGGDRRAWHLASAAQEGSEEAALALEEAAFETRSRGGVAESASAFERAAELSVDDAARARRLREAASDARLAGRADWALDLLERALGYAHDPVLRARIQHLRGAIEMWEGSAAAAHDLLVAEAARIEALDRGRASEMLTAASWAGYMAGHIAEGLASARRAHELAEGQGEETETIAAAVLGIGLVLVGEAKRALPLLSGYHESLLEGRGAGALANQLIRPAGQVLTWFERYDEARETLTETIGVARERSALGGLPYTLSALSELDYRTGAWASAYAGAAEAVRIAEDTGQVSLLAYALVCMAQVEAAQGREADCRAHAARAIELASLRAGAAVAFAEAALGLLELGLGRVEAAEAHFVQLGARAGEHGLREPGVIQWVPDLVEARIRAGRGDDAAATLAEFEAAAGEAERLWALAAAARCRGLLAPDDAFEAIFAEALELHARTPTPFERARTELCLGERLRRARRRSDARAPLRSALETFEQLGAAPWAERARHELAATGETVAARDPAAADTLTPTEVQVALLVGRGATNKEAGAALFLSPKTIETHLGRVYRKLGVRSRTELAHVLARGVAA